MIELVGHVVLAGLTPLAWLGLGTLALHPLRAASNPLLHVLNRIGAGAVALALLTMGLGWIDALDSTVLRIAFFASALGGIIQVARASHDLVRPRFHEWRPWQVGLALLLGIYCVLAVMATGAPISSPDALLYHAADPARFEESGRIFEVTWNSSSYEPFTVEMLFLYGNLVWDSVLGAFSPLLLALLALATVMGFGHMLGGRSAALVAGAVFFAQPFMLWNSTSVFVEPGLAAAVALASWNLAEYVRNPDANLSPLVLTGTFAGAAAGIKYLGLIACAGIAVTLVILTWPRNGLARLGAFLVPATLVAAPWYVKNAVLTGNPFYPHLFGGLNAAAAAELDRAMASFGSGQGLLDFLLLPITLLIDGESFDAGEWISPLFLAFAPLALLVPQPRRVRIAVSLAFLVFVVSWFLTSQQARFLVPLMPPAAVLAALGSLAIAGRGCAARAVTVGTFAVVLAGGLAASAVYAARLAPAAVGAQSDHAFLEKSVSIYTGVDWLNRNLDADDRVAVSFWSLLYLTVPYVTFGTMGDLLPPRASMAETAAFVEEHGVTHMAVLAGDAERRRQAEAVGGTIIAKVPVRSVRSRTRRELGPTQTMLVYELSTSR